MTSRALGARKDFGRVTAFTNRVGLGFRFGLVPASRVGSGMDGLGFFCGRETDDAGCMRIRKQHRRGLRGSPTNLQLFLNFLRAYFFFFFLQFVGLAQRGGCHTRGSYMCRNGDDDVDD